MRRVLVVLTLGFLATSLYRRSEAADQFPVGKAPVARYGWVADQRNVVRFSTTTAAASTAICVVSTHTAGNFLTVSGMNYLPTQTSSTTVTGGGRGYVMFQIVDTPNATDRVAVDLWSAGLSVTSSPYLLEGQWWSPDDPVAWQGPVCLISATTFTVTGWYITEKRR